ncbi:patatin-like phospholipase family protein [Marinomonas ostreistagni]|uniref:patatin-like phospholipase family protein n=1 Tax=Marinomonas ostreistagni TaxID=359209 RepID=UPI00194EF72B|nr:patatin-like phospholipase family protein [Marinomonas ostreistagni]MBM6550194.1 patatin-like phospholipase family protein [Marinomonas ostreistagni]
MAQKTVSLVLGSGAARGHAHIGVINAVLEKGYKIVSVSGCSIGAIIGGIYLSGKLKEYQQWAEALDKFHVLKLLDMAVLMGGYIRGDRYFQVIEALMGDQKIETLPLPFTAVGVDILSQKEFWFQKGSLLQAMRASSAVPSIVAPVEIDGRVYVDGGVLNPLPIIPTVSAGADYIIAVDLNGPAENLPENNFIVQQKEVEWWQNLKGFFARDKDSDEPAEVEDKTSLEPVKRYDPQSWGRVQTINMMFETMQESLTQYKIAGYPPDLLISIPKDACTFYEFWRSKELIDLGYKVAIDALENLEQPARSYFSFPSGH